MMNKKFTLFLFALSALCFASANAADNNSYVDLFIGTAGDNGQVDPAACVPYGMVRACPDMDPRSHSGYDYDVTQISGFSVNRVSGVGCKGSGGNLSIAPGAPGQALEIVKTTERATPGYYAVGLTNGVKVELTATHNIAVERFVYPTGTDAVMTIDVSSTFIKMRDFGYHVMENNRIIGFVKAGTTCNKGFYEFYFDLRTDRPFEIVSQDRERVQISFGKSDGKPVEVRIALSPINSKTAAEENALVAGQSFGSLRKAAAAQWNTILGRVNVAGGTKEQKTIFYTSLYRTFLSPGHVTAHNSKFKATDGSIQNAPDFTYYGSWSMWDTYRTKFPMIALLDPAAMRSAAISLSRLYRHGKQPWATKYESMPTVRTEHSSVVMLDAYEKGIIDIELAEAYPYIIEELNTLRVDRPDVALEAVIDIWAAARIAQHLGRADDAVKLDKQAEELFRTTWTQHFMSPDDSYITMKDNGLYQGTKWQYRWAVPQLHGIMSELVGGSDVLESQLAYYFDNDLNNQGNEPGLHAPYIFNLLGQPEKTQRLVTKMMTEPMTHLYGGNAEYPEPVVSKIFKAEPVGFLPEMDEDDGTMGAWYAFSAMGIFPLVVGEPYYEIVSPLFNKVTLTLPGGKKFTIQTKGRKNPKQTIKSAKLNGRSMEGFKLSHHDIAAGGKLELYY